MVVTVNAAIIDEKDTVVVAIEKINAGDEVIWRDRNGDVQKIKAMSDNIDIDASPYIYGTKTMTELGDELMKEIKEVADGKLTKAEALGYTEMAIARVCNYM